MIGLTVRQPFASQIVAGTKLIENRTWAPPEVLRGETIAVHSAARPHDLALPSALAEIRAGRMPLAAVLGTATLADWHPAIASSCAARGCPFAGGFLPGQWPWENVADGAGFHWQLAEPVEFMTPLPSVRGALGFWQLLPTTAYLVTIAEARA